MNQKIRRQDLKRNELAETVGRTVGFVTDHRKGVTEAVLIAAGVAVLVLGFFAWRSYVARGAARDLSAALAVLDTPLASEQAGAGKTYATAAERRTAADALLQKAASRGSTPAGRAAQVILAASADQPAQSGEVFEKVARRGKSEVSAIAEIDAAKLLASQGKTSEAIDRLKRALDSSETSAPKDALLFTLGEIYEQTGASADARATYQRLITDYPNSPYRTDARQKVPLS